MAKQLPQPCGTWAAYKRHLRKDEYCKTCLDGAAQRRRAKGIPEAKKAKCGENSASYKVHVRNNEPICAKCKELRNANSRNRYERNKAKRLERQRELYADNIEHKRELTRRKSHRRRARKMDAVIIDYSVQDVLNKYGTNCHICNKPIDLTAARQVGFAGWETGLHIDHVIPISKGGNDTLENVRPSHGKCNITKGATQWAF